jgi:hypothetical protein
MVTNQMKQLGFRFLVLRLMSINIKCLQSNSILTVAVALPIPLTSIAASPSPEAGTL